MVHVKTVSATIIVAFLSACSSVESDLKSFMKCMIVANEMGMQVASQNVAAKMDKYLTENNIEGSAGYGMRLGEEVRNDLGLYSQNLEGQIYTMIDVYNSSTCVAMHEQAKLEGP